MNVFDLFARITLDTSDYERELGNAKKKSSTFGDVLKATLTSQAIITGVKTLATAVKNVGQAALEGYADFEQLAGGVETLFKKQSLEEFIAANKGAGMSIAALKEEYSKLEQASDTVIKNAQTAYKTAGLSANAYLETVTSFSASLLQSLGGDTEAAVKYADQAIIDMADNANKMGSSMESIQNAYQGFAKQNYTMLDNLKLGYGGTQAEMYRLMKDAEALGAKFNSEFYLTTKGALVADFADITEAIHVVQEEMGIAGATAAEAEGTISGSAAAMKGAWTNLVTGLADGNADVNSLLDEFLGSVATLGKNVIPVVKTILTNIGKTFEENGPEMIAQGALMLAKLAVGIIQAIPDVIAKIPEVVRAVVEEFKERGPEFKQIGKDLLEGIWNGISDKIAWLKGKVRGVVDKIKGWFTGSDGFDTHSPSKWSEKVFRNVMEGSGKGLESGMPAMMRTTKSVTDRIKSGLSFEAGEITPAKANPVKTLLSGAAEAIFGDINITVQSVLDGRVIAESVARYSRATGRAYGV